VGDRACRPWCDSEFVCSKPLGHAGYHDCVLPSDLTVHTGPPVGPDEWDCPCGHAPKRIEENCSLCDRRQSVWDPPATQEDDRG
jgi:hypothetical protein